MAWRPEAPTWMAVASAVTHGELSPRQARRHLHKTKQVQQELQRVRSLRSTGERRARAGGKGARDLLEELEAEDGARASRLDAASRLTAKPGPGRPSLETEAKAGPPLGSRRPSSVAEQRAALAGLRAGPSPQDYGHDSDVYQGSDNDDEEDGEGQLGRSLGPPGAADTSLGFAAGPGGPLGFASSGAGPGARPGEVLALRERVRMAEEAAAAARAGAEQAVAAARREAAGAVAVAVAAKEEAVGAVSREEALRGRLEEAERRAERAEAAAAEQGRRAREAEGEARRAGEEAEALRGGLAGAQGEAADALEVVRAVQGALVEAHRCGLLEASSGGVEPSARVRMLLQRAREAEEAAADARSGRAAAEARAEQERARAERAEAELEAELEAAAEAGQGAEAHARELGLRLAEAQDEVSQLWRLKGEAVALRRRVTEAEAAASDAEAQLSAERRARGVAEELLARSAAGGGASAGGGAPHAPGSVRSRRALSPPDSLSSAGWGGAGAAGGLRLPLSRWPPLTRDRSFTHDGRTLAAPSRSFALGPSGARGSAGGAASASPSPPDPALAARAPSLYAPRLRRAGTASPFPRRAPPRSPASAWDPTGGAGGTPAEAWPGRGRPLAGREPGGPGGAAAPLTGPEHSAPPPVRHAAAPRGEAGKDEPDEPPVPGSPTPSGLLTGPAAVRRFFAAGARAGSAGGGSAGPDSSSASGAGAGRGGGGARATSRGRRFGGGRPAAEPGRDSGRLGGGSSGGERFTVPPSPAASEPLPPHPVSAPTDTPPFSLGAAHAVPGQPGSPGGDHGGRLEDETVTSPQTAHPAARTQDGDNGSKDAVAAASGRDSAGAGAGAADKPVTSSGGAHATVPSHPAESETHGSRRRIRDLALDAADSPASGNGGTRAGGLESNEARADSLARESSEHGSTSGGEPDVAGGAHSGVPDGNSFASEGSNSGSDVQALQLVTSGLSPTPQTIQGSKQ